MQPIAPEQLVRLCQETLPHDTRYFEQLVSQNKERVFNAAYRILSNYHDAEDATQEIFLRVYRHIKNLQEPSTFTSWLYRIISSVCMDALSSKKRNSSNSAMNAHLESAHRDGAEDWHPAFVDTHTLTPEETAIRLELIQCLQEALAGMDSPGRTAIVLRDIEERPYQDIADSLKIGLSALKMRIHRARVAFQQVLLKVCPDAWQGNDTQGV